MKPSTVDRVAWTTVFIIGLGLISLFVLIGWGFVEIVLWLTSK